MRPRERERVWRGVADGSAKIVVGARSALFLPWKKLGLIVVDEEHESAYKQDDGVPYHARDMAVLYGVASGKFPVVLSSATPSLETLVNVDRGRYGVVRLKDRHGRPELPEIGLIDMKRVALEPGTWLSAPLFEEVQKTLAEGDQALLFLNRRGYAPLTLCRACGHRLECPNCAASLVEHRFRRQLMCHHCGHLEPMPQECPHCHVPRARWCRWGRASSGWRKRRRRAFPTRGSPFCRAISRAARCCAMRSAMWRRGTTISSSARSWWPRGITFRI